MTLPNGTSGLTNRPMTLPNGTSSPQNRPMTSQNGISVFRFGRQLANGLCRSDYGSSEPVALPNQIGKLKKKNASYYLKGYYSSLPRQDSPSFSRSSSHRTHSIDCPMGRWLDQGRGLVMTVGRSKMRTETEDRSIMREGPG